MQSPPLVYNHAHVGVVSFWQHQEAEQHPADCLEYPQVLMHHPPVRARARALCVCACVGVRVCV